MSQPLDDMPLHDITELIGTTGLRERFGIEVQRLPIAERPRLQEALRVAAELHRDDWRTREPYLNHLLRVAIRIVHHYRIDDADVICAALLHDAVEDHPFELATGQQIGADAPASTMDPDTLTAAALAVVAARFGDRVAELVSAVTNPHYDETRDKDVQYREHVIESLSANPWARVIKLSDFTDNAVGIGWTTHRKAQRVAPKYYPLIDDLRALAARPDTPLDDDVKAHIDAQLVLAEQRLGALVDEAR